MALPHLALGAALDFCRVDSVQTCVCRRRRGDLKSGIHHKISATDLQRISFTTKADLIYNSEEGRDWFSSKDCDWWWSPDVIMKPTVTRPSDIYFAQLCWIKHQACMPLLAISQHSTGLPSCLL